MKTPYIDRNTTAAIKALALIMMFVHHFFAFPEYYIAGISYPAIAPLVRFLRTPTRLCVPVFAFLTGYFYHFSRAQTLRYSLGKIKDFLISYWVVYGVLMIPALALGCWNFSGREVVGALFGWDDAIMVFCWYVYFYILAMLALPVLVKLSTGTLIGDCLLLVLPVAVTGVLLGMLQGEFGVESGALVELLQAGEEWLPCIVGGYLFARYGLFESYCDSVSGRIRTNWGKVLLWLSLCGAAFFGRLLCPRITLGNISVAGRWRGLTFTMDLLYAPMFVYGAANLLRSIRMEKLKMPLVAIGRKSMLMWFLHCAFFNCCRAFTQPVLYCLKNPVLVLLFGLGICYLAAVILDIPIGKLRKLLSRKG